MQKLTFALPMLLLVACASENDVAAEPSSGSSAPVSEATEQPDVASASTPAGPAEPCELLETADIAAAFAAEAATFEQYPRSPYPDTRRCEFLWSDPANPAGGRQVTVTISTNGELAAMPRRYSNMLRRDLEQGLLASDQQTIKPTPISGLGEFAYAWEQTQMQRVAKIKFQKDEQYLVEVMFSTSDQDLPEDAADALQQVGQLVWQRL